MAGSGRLALAPVLSLAWPWLMAALPAPALVCWLAPRAAGEAETALRVPFFASARSWGAADTRARPRPGTYIALLGWALLVTAACRPQWTGEPRAIAVTGRDLLLALDVSASMKVDDLLLGGHRRTRLDVVREIAGDFVRRRVGDRVALVLFGSRAYLQSPLTFDRAAVGAMLDGAVIGLAGEQTAIGDAIGLAVKRLRARPAAQRVVVLLTDGADTASEVAPLDAARMAAAAGVRIHTIGVGADELAVRDVLGTRKVNPSAELDEHALEGIATLTGGRYFRARSTQELEAVYMLLDGIEPAAAGDESLRPRRELYVWPLAGAAALALALVVAAAAPGRPGRS